MNTYVMMLSLCLIVNQTLGSIKNGYEVDIEKVQQALLNLQRILEKNDLQIAASQKLSYLKERQIKSRIDWLREHLVYYELTEKLLSQFRGIAPDLYQQIDTIKDRNGSYVDVYIKFIPEGKMARRVAGTTNLSQAPGNAHTYNSEYGGYTISVKIAISNRSLSLLAHELGHVGYQVPNLASYMKYYIKNYEYSDSNLKGHNSKDPSGQNAHMFEKKFIQQYHEYLKKTGNKMSQPHVMLNEIRKSSSAEMNLIDLESP